MNVLDRAISALSPAAGVKRVVDRRRIDILNSGYGNYGAAHHKKSTKGWNYSGGSANEDIHENLSTLRERSRDLYAGVPLATGALKTMRTNVIGSGLVLKSQIDKNFLRLTEEQAKQIEDTIEREFALWADSDDCDMERLDNFVELQQLVFINWLLSGEVFVLLPTTQRTGMPYDLRVQLVESDRVCTPGDKTQNQRIICGVETTAGGEVVAYHIKNSHPLSNDFNGKPGYKRVCVRGVKTGRRNVLHIMNRERIGQLRGVPYLAPVIEALKQLGTYTEAELVAAVVNGMFAVFIESPEGNIGAGAALGEVVPEGQQVDASDPNSIEIGNGTIVDLAPGEKANSVAPGRPNSNFEPFVLAICKQIGTALEIPFEVLVKHFGASYSASRGALLELWKAVKMYRGWFASDFCQPIFEEWFAEAVAKGRVKAPGFFTDPAIRKAYCGAEWNGPAQLSLDPVKEVRAAQMRVESSFSTADREAQELNGSDFYKNVEQRVAEEKLKKEVRDIEQGTSVPNGVGG